MVVVVACMTALMVILAVLTIQAAVDYFKHRRSD